MTHYNTNELPNKTPYTGEVYTGYLKTWILPKWDELFPFRCQSCGG